MHKQLHMIDNIHIYFANPKSFNYILHVILYFETRRLQFIDLQVLTFLCEVVF
jgi:hypothetical protein